MYNAIIDGGTTFLFLDNGSDDVYKGEMSGFLINNDNIINLMENIPIKQYYVSPPKGNISKISKEQAYYLYQQVIDYNNNKEKLNNKR